MELEQYNFSVEEVQENNLKDLLIKYIFHWKWFVVSIIFGIIFGFVFLRYQVPQYEVNATILIKDDKKGGSVSDELSAFEDLGILKNNKNIENEIEILKSRYLMTMVVKELKLNIKYFSHGRPIVHERYSDTPILAHYIGKDTLTTAQGNWIVIPESDKKFILENGDTKEKIGSYNFGDAIPTFFGKIIFTTTSFFSDANLNKDFIVAINPIEEVVNSYLGSINVSPVSKTSNAIRISLRDAIANRAANVVDNLIKQHNIDAVVDKNQVSENTVNFINERIDYITKELSEVEGAAENFKTKNRLTDVKSEGEIFLKSSNENEMNFLEASTQVSIAEFMNDYIQKHDKPSDLIPANLGLNDIQLSIQISDYNKLVLERNRLLKNSSEYYLPYLN